ncbi:MAG: hypothetical protein K2Z81_26395, partial [Cyanobacteria bacterium]|nr:hypothetical protein [Cyanobacteriota bacterium]
FQYESNCSPVTWFTMPIVVSAEESIDLTGGRLAQGMMPDGSAKISFDSRRLTDGSWFMALRGRNFDGHDFIGDAYSAGAIGCIVEERTNYPIAETSFPLIAVGDSMYALKDLAKSWCQRLSVSVVLVSSGDRGQSSRMASMLNDLLSPRRSARLIDLAEVSEPEALIRIMELEPTTDIAVVNLVPNELEFISLIAEATSPELFVLLGEPFAYLRLTSSGQEIERSMAAVMAAMHDGKGEIITCGEGSYSIACRLKLEGMEIRSYERNIGMSTDDLRLQDEPDDEDLLCFAPVETEQAKLDGVEKWILNECKRVLKL